MNNTYVCKRYRLYTYLTNKGFKVIETLPDARRADYINWVYEDTEELRNALDYYFTHETKAYQA